MSFLQIARTQPGSKQRFDRFLAQFGFVGISSQNQHDAKKQTSLLQRGPPTTLPKETERSNFRGNNKNRHFVNENVVKVGESYYRFTIKKRRKKTFDSYTGVKAPNPQHLNERFQNPVFRSKFPKRMHSSEIM